MIRKDLDFTNNRGLIGEQVMDGDVVHRRVTQDISPFLEKAKEDRDLLKTKQKHTKQYRKFATIPDSVAIAILTDHGLDLHAPDFFHDKNKAEKFKQIIIRDYPYLVVST